MMCFFVNAYVTLYLNKYEIEHKCKQSRIKPDLSDIKNLCLSCFSFLYRQNAGIFDRLLSTLVFLAGVLITQYLFRKLQ